MQVLGVLSCFESPKSFRSQIICEKRFDNNSRFNQSCQNCGTSASLFIYNLQNLKIISNPFQVFDCGAMRIVGLTGGIASGKSTASKEFEALGVPIIDADKVARAASKKGTLAWRRIVLTFGKEILQEDGEIDRGRLGEIIFSDHAKRKALNSAMSFSIGIGLYWELFKHWIKGTKVVIMDVPLLFEAKLDRLTKPIIVVWVDPETQEARLVKRDKISKELALKKISSQLSLDEKRDRADIVIDNTSSIEAMKQQVQDIYKEIVATPSTMKELLFSRRGIFFLLATTIFGLWWLKG